jgi:ABC-type branched-subunit amino acid transport system ATPase component
MVRHTARAYHHSEVEVEVEVEVERDNRAAVTQSRGAGRASIIHPIHTSDQKKKG